MNSERRATIIKGATVLTMVDSRLPVAADILVIGGIIAEIGPRLTAPQGAEIIDATGMIALPGFINAHIHLWQAGFRGTAGNWSFLEYFERMLSGIANRMTPEDIALGNEIGAWEQIEAGVTTLFDWSHALGSPAHADAAIAGLEAVGIRAIFGYGPPADMAKWWYESQLRHPEDVERIATNLQGNGRIGLALAIRGPDFTDDAVLARDVAAARDLGALVSAHIGVSRAANAPQDGVARMARAGSLGPDINLAHANNLSDDEHERLVGAGATVTVAPEIEVQTGMRLPATGAVLRAGGLPSIGTDVTAAYSPDMFGQMRLALQLQRFADQEKAAHSDEPHAKPLAARTVVEMATIGGARALRLDAQVGTLEKGKRADILLLRSGFAGALTKYIDPFEAVALQSGVINVDTVMIEGVVRKRGGKLIGGPSPHKIDALARSVERLMAG